MQDTHSKFFRAWGELVIRHRWVALLLLFALTGASMYQVVTGLYVDNSPEAFLDSDSESARVLDTFRDTFGRDDVTMLLVGGDVFSLDYIKRLDALHDEMAAINIELETLGERKRLAKSSGNDAPSAATPEVEKPAPGDMSADDLDVEFDDDFGDDDAFGEDQDADDGGWGDEAGGSVIEQVTSLINVRKTRATSDGIEVGELMDPMPTTAEALTAIRDQVLGNAEKDIPVDETMVGQVVSKDGGYSVLLMRAQFMHQKDSIKLSNHILELVAKHQAPGFKIHVSGLPALNANFEKVILADMAKLTMLMMLVIGVILLVMFWHVIGAIIPLLVVAFSGIWAVGFMATMGIPLTGMSSIIPAFLVCVGVADSVHLMSVYRQLRMEGVPNQEATVRAVSETGKPVFFTSLTTATGLISFMFASVDAVGDMGIVASFGVLAAFFNTVTLLPILLSFNQKSMLGAHKQGPLRYLDTLLAILAGFSGESTRGRRTTLFVCASLAATALFGSTMLYVWHDPLTWLPKDQPVRVAFDLSDEHLGGTANVQLLFEGTGERGVKDVRLLQGMIDLAAHVREYKQPKTGEMIVGNARGLADMVREINRALRGGGNEHYVIPKEQAVADHLFVMIENSGPDEQRRLMTLDGRITQMSIGMKWQEATSYLPLIEHVEAGVKKYIPSDVAKVSMTGAVYSLLSTVGLLLLDMISTFGIAFAVITVFMVLLLGDVKLGLIAMVPNLLPIILILGLMGFAGIPIDMMNMMIASIALGIAVDDTIHFLHHFRTAYAAHGKVEEAIQH
ncbi:MAG: putative RND superfamily exporter protein, partial [Myxococcota bacterium]